MQSFIRLATYTTVHSVVDRPRNDREKNGVTYYSGRSVVLPHLDGKLGPWKSDRNGATLARTMYHCDIGTSHDFFSVPSGLFEGAANIGATCQARRLSLRLLSAH